MGLSDLSIQDEYRSDRVDIIRDFYLPCLEQATVYKRAVGFFSSTSMAAAARGITALIRSGGKMQLVASPYLSPEDAEAIATGLKQRQDVITDTLLRELDQEFEQVVRDRLACLAWLLGQGILEIKLAVASNLDQPGIYHEKLGIFVDNQDNIVAFTGSANESSSALIDNFECIDVFCSWHLGVKERVLRKAENFQRLWDNQTPKVEVIEFPEAAARSLLRLRPEYPPPLEELPEQSRIVSELRGTYQMDDLDPWRHQTQAMTAFLQKRCGILEMATGTGKTRTSLNIIRELVAQQAINSVIITAIGTDLLDQWSNQLYAVASQLNPRFRVLKHYATYYDKDEYELDPENSLLILSRNALRNVLRSLTRPTRSRLLLIHDEVHGLGSPANIEELDGLSEHISYRLGLSATPEREYDQEGTAFIERNVGSIIYRFSLEDAIRRGILCEFDYYPIEYHLSDQDRQRIRNVYSQKAARNAEGNPMSDEQFWTALARVYKTSRAKLPYFEMFLSERSDILDRCIIFVENRDYGEEVINIVHRYRYDFHTYYAEDDRQHLIDFVNNRITCLITCHRISQGIDIPSLRSVILFSSARAKLETIQRMGRCLRKDPANPDKRAIVVDFVRVQDENAEELNSDQLRKDWLMSLSKIRCEET
ncbi:MAG: DEAD/DEAH box helicase family protein [Coleofasciculus sp. D1-CHI-01]|uniref:DEAD/DEAH box helicase family protein n=1 Tax=Coleofasciculus sp. D1-CHI-01 TaxID=3068482 RepID=UPI0032F67C1E